MTAVAEYRKSRELYSNLTLRELRSKYRRSALGWGWSMFNPLANMLVYTVVFSVFLKVKPPVGNPSGIHVYALFLMSAMLPWNFFSNCVTGSIVTLISNGNLIKKSYFPRELLPASAVGANFVMHLIEMGILTGVLVAFGNWRALVYLPVTFVLIVIMATFALGVGLLFSILNVYFRDIEHFTNILFLIWMYMTPLLYPPSYLAAHTVHGVSLLTLAKINPMTDFAAAFRATMYNGTMPTLYGFLYITAAATSALAVGLYVFARLEGRLAEEL